MFNEKVYKNNRAEGIRGQGAEPKPRLGIVEGAHIISINSKLVSTNRTLARRAGDFKRAQKPAPAAWPYPPDMTSSDRMEWRRNRRKSLQQKAYDSWPERYPDLSKFITEVLAELQKRHPNLFFGGHLTTPPHIDISVSAQATARELNSIRAYLRNQSKNRWFPVWFKAELMVF